VQRNRRHDRVHSRLRCWCEGDNVTVYARIENLSEGGLFLRTSAPLRQGSRAKVRFGQGGPSSLEAEATVVWARGLGESAPFGMGLKFDTDDAIRREEIRRLVREEYRGLETR
jgi:uncharacterized protein (TIGR02266 family)